MFSPILMLPSSFMCSPQLIAYCYVSIVQLNIVLFWWCSEMQQSYQIPSLKFMVEIFNHYTVLNPETKYHYRWSFAAKISHFLISSFWCGIIVSPSFPDLVQRGPFNFLLEEVVQSINAVQESSWPPFGFFYISLFGTPIKLIMIKDHNIHKCEIIIFIFLTCFIFTNWK